MTGWTKLFGSIVSSSIWQEDDKTRIVWLTMLAIKDMRGIVSASIPGLANIARVSLADCEKAIGKLSSPDKYSCTQEDEGRRIRAIDGGWLIINAAKYRDARDQDARRRYMRDLMRRKRAKAVSTSVSNVSQKLAHTDTDTDINTVPVSQKRLTDASVSAEQIYQAYPLKVGKPAALRAIVLQSKQFPAHFLLERTRAFAEARNGDKAYCPHPATWFNQQRFNDDPATWTRPVLPPAKPKKEFRWV